MFPSSTPRSPLTPLIAQAMATQTFTANIRKVQRKGRIFLDWLRNQRGATAVMPYSARGREGAPVAAPIAWEEIDDYEGSNAFSILDLDLLFERSKPKRLASWGEAKRNGRVGGRDSTHCGHWRRGNRQPPMR